VQIAIHRRSDQNVTNMLANLIVTARCFDIVVELNARFESGMSRLDLSVRDNCKRLRVAYDADFSLYIFRKEFIAQKRPENFEIY
jgi:hypothetical protein